MNRILMGGLIAICIFAFNVSQSKAQTNPGTDCKPMEEAVAYLEKTYGEFLSFRGLSLRGHVTTIYMNETTGTWTALVLYPSLDHKMCVVDSGTIGERLEGEKENKINFDPAQNGFRKFFNVNTAYEYLLRIFGSEKPEIERKPL
tara:strand:+ start:4893 stop:5327 length:435 start_codon:yes stop_codon:yes gene_type:complete